MITREVLDVLSDKKIPFDKLTCIATNGAAVMTRKTTGIVQQLKGIVLTYYPLTV